MRGSFAVADNFIYNRTIDIHRPKTQAIAGSANVASLRSYTGTTADTTSATGETVTFTNRICSIQFISPLTRGSSTLPSDTHAPGAWRVFIPDTVVPKGTAANPSILNRDILIDDLNNRYQVEDAYWTAFGYNLRARMLEL